MGTGSSGTVGIKVSAADTRRYRYVELPNRLQVVLVHDPDVPQVRVCTPRCAPVEAPCGPTSVRYADLD